MWLLLIQLVYVIPTVALYILTVCTVIVKWTTFKSSFFQFFFFDFGVNIFTLLNTFYVLRFANYTCDTCFLAPIFQNLDKYFSSAFFYAMQYHMAYVQYSSTLITSLNRLSVIYNFGRFEPLWKKYSFIAMLSILVLPTPNTIWMMGYGTSWTYDEEQSRFLLHSPLIMLGITPPTSFVFSLIVYAIPFISDCLTLCHPWLLIWLSKPVRDTILNIIRPTPVSSSILIIQRR
ncbi:hypothetical protein CRE_20955 [Caenorhabditis remanei]|uniref:Serpentine receptor class gamma n=1 Tax=Caenorhabditis remanei TaxID=31234 RepID=E3NCR2_CAERE|nr:hypothetical protein CRE_20955 [Caenorhabditis remanei]